MILIICICEAGCKLKTSCLWRRLNLSRKFGQEDDDDIFAVSVKPESSSSLFADQHTSTTGNDDY